MANFRYMVNCAEETLDTFWTGLLIQGGTYNPPKVKEYGGTKVATAVGTYTTQSCNIGQELQTILASPRYTITNGYLTMRMKYAHVSQSTVWSCIISADPNLISAYYFYISVDPGTGCYLLRAQKSVYDPWFLNVNTGITADATAHTFEVRLGRNKIYYRIDNSTLTESAIPEAYQLVSFSPIHCHVNGWAYIYWYELVLSLNDIYTEDEEVFAVDGAGIPNATVNLWDTTSSPPDYTLTTGADGSIDFSAVADGTYSIGITDPGGYSCAGELEIYEGEPGEPPPE